VPLRAAAAEDRWETAGWMYFGYSPPPVLLDDGSVLLAGGSSTYYGAGAEVFIPSTGTWQPTGRMRAARRGQGASPLPDGRVLISGGYNDAEEKSGTPPEGSISTATAEIYDPDTGSFSATGTMVGGRRTGHAAMALRDGRVLVAGGRNSTGFLASAELYDPATGLWSRTADMNVARSQPLVAPLPDGRVLVAGKPCSMATVTMGPAPVSPAACVTGSTSVQRCRPRTSWNRPRSAAKTIGSPGSPEVEARGLQAEGRRAALGVQAHSPGVVARFTHRCHSSAVDVEP
jgi:hypothetical protein